MSIRHIGILVSKEFLYGSKSFIVIFAVIAPIMISMIISLIFGTWISEKPKLGMMDEGASRLVSMLEKQDAIDSFAYDTLPDLKQEVETGAVDIGLVIPQDFDEYVSQSKKVEINAFIWGESIAKNRTILGITIASTIRELAGQQAPVEIKTISLGDDESIPWSDRLFPLIVLMAIFLGGLMLPASSIVAEKEKRTLRALMAAPLSLEDVFVAKGIFGFMLSFFMGMLILILNNAFGAKPLLLTAVLVLGAMMASAFGMLLGVYAKDFSTIFTVWKSAGIILFAPAIIYMFPGIPQWIGRVFPTYYLTQPVVELSQMGSGWVDISTNTFILIAIDFVLISALLILLRRKQYVAGSN